MSPLGATAYRRSSSVPSLPIVYRQEFPAPMTRGYLDQAPGSSTHALLLGPPALAVFWYRNRPSSPIWKNTPSPLVKTVSPAAQPSGSMTSIGPPVIVAAAP